MKSRSLIALLFTCFIAFGLVSCGDDSTSSNNGGSGAVKGTMTATVAGSSWSANTLLQAQKNSTSLGITGDEIANGRDKKIQFNLNGVSGPGTFSVGGFAANMITYIDIPVGTTDPQVIMTSMESAVTGSVTITELTDAKVKGTFSFNTSKTTVSNGSFDVNF